MTNSPIIKKRRRWDEKAPGAPDPIEINDSSSESDDACMIVPITAPNPYSKTASGEPNSENKKSTKGSRNSGVLCLTTEENEKLINIDYFHNPFFTQLYFITKPTQLLAVNKNMYQRSAQLKIGIPWEWYQRLVNVDDSYDLVLRIFETRQPHIDYLPHEIKVTVNGIAIPPPKTIIATEAGILPKPIAKPMTLTRFIKKRSKLQADNQTHFDIINISWAHCDGKRGRATPAMNYVIGVGRSNNLNEVVKRMSERKRPRSFQETEKLLNSKISGKSDNGDVQMNAMKIKFIDAIKMSIIKTPVRFDKCQHLDCFDLESYLMMNQVKPSWACPICNGRFAFGTLRQDLWFAKIMKDAGNGAREIIMNGDGSFKITEKEDDCEDNNLDWEKGEKNEKSQEKVQKIIETPDEQNMHKILADENVEINEPICLESSDEENFVKDSEMKTKTVPKTVPKIASKTAPETVVQVDLDDSDDLDDYDSGNEIPKTSVLKPKPLREGFGRRFKRKKIVTENKKSPMTNPDTSRISKHFEKQKYSNFQKGTPEPEKLSVDDKSTEPGKKWELKVPSAPVVPENSAGWGSGNPFSDDRT